VLKQAEAIAENNSRKVKDKHYNCKVCINPNENGSQEVYK